MGCSVIHHVVLSWLMNRCDLRRMASTSDLVKQIDDDKKLSKVQLQSIQVGSLAVINKQQIDSCKMEGVLSISKLHVVLKKAMKDATLADPLIKFMLIRVGVGCEDVGELESTDAKSINEEYKDLDMLLTLSSMLSDDDFRMLTNSHQLDRQEYFGQLRDKGKLHNENLQFFYEKLQESQLRSKKNVAHLVQYHKRHNIKVPEQWTTG